MKSRFARQAAAVAVVSLIALAAYAAARGTADFTRFVAIGDSYGAGFEAGSLNQNHQSFSWPAVVARQVGLPICSATAAATDNCFAVPLVSAPGLPGGELVFNGVTVVTVPGAGAPLNSGFGRPFNNLSIPGATVGDVTTVTGAEKNPTRGVELLARFILRGLGTEVDQALALHPTFIAIWIGGNDFLGAVSQGSPATLTPLATFTTQYNAMLDKLIAGAPTAGMVVGTLPTSLAAPPLTGRLPGILLDPNGNPVLIGGAPVPLVADLGGGVIGPLPAGSVVLLSSLGKLQQGFGIPPQLKNVPPFNALPHAGEPLADADVITPTEAAAFQQRIADFNTVITQAASARNIPVADIKGLFDRFATPMTFGGVTLTNAFVSGGIFSNDGVHLTDIGYTLFGNEFIKAINAGYGTHIPLASLTQFLSNNGANIGFNPKSTISPEAEKAMMYLFTPLPQPPARRRASTH